MEVLRVNVVYFLSRSGRVEHPHLIRVHHRSRNGVRLLDVKRWLAEIRGKDMPDTFAWSYKRKYRTGYVWQDLIVDDDLITPVSDNEYVLKGSQILHANAAIANQHHFLSLDNSPAPSIQGKEKAPGAADDDGQKAEVETHPKSSSPTSEILQQDDDDEFTSSGASDEPTIWRKAVFKIDAFRQRVGKEKVAAEVAKEGAPRGRGGVRTVRSSGSDGNSYAKRATEALWSILTCRYNCTDDEALHPILRRREKGRSGGAGAGAGADGGVLNQNDSSRKERAKRKGPKRMGEKGAVHPTSFNPAYVPDCSQCGRAFKPEKLHIHMKSCKELAKERKKIA